MIKFLTTSLLLLSLAATQAAVTPRILVPLQSFGTNGDGTIRPGDLGYFFLTGDGNRYQRGMAYNPATGHLLIVNRRTDVDHPDAAIEIIDAFTGDYVGRLDTSDMFSGGSSGFPLNAVVVADDGAIFACNLTTSGTLVELNVYRWDNEASAQHHVFFGNPATTASGNSRWGDHMAVRGVGVDTEILFSNVGNKAAVLKATDGTMTTYVSFPFDLDASGSTGDGLAFGVGNTIYTKSASADGNPLYLFSYNTNTAVATTLQKYPAQNFPGRVGPLMTQVASNLLVGIDVTAGTLPDIVRMYDISDTSVSPVFLDRKTQTTMTNANAIFGGAVSFGSSNVYVLDSDNGLVAYTVLPGAPTLAPSVFSQPLSQISQITSNVTLYVGADGTLPLAPQWQFSPDNVIAPTNLPTGTNISLVLSNVAVSQQGYYSVVITNNYGSATSAVAQITVLPNFGNLLAYDPFAYPEGSILAGQGGWTFTSTAPNGAIEGGNLTVPGLRESVGRRYTWTNTSSVRFPFGQYSAGDVYASFAFRLDTASTSSANETTAGFSFGTSTVFPLKINIIGDGAGGYQIGLYKGGGTTGNGIIDTGHTYHAGDTLFVVCRYGFHAGANQDAIDLWVNPDVTTFGSNNPPTATIANQGVGTAQSWTFIDRFFWRWASAGYTKRTSDELRIGFSWAEVTPTAPPSLSIVAAGSNANISWPVFNSSGYVLESNLHVNDAGGWEASGATINVQNGTNTVTVPASGTKYYRLRK